MTKDKFLSLSFQESGLMNELRSFNPKEKERILKALSFAKEKHKGQERDEVGVPYIIHPIRVALILTTELNIKDPDVIAAALLHDSLEDTDTSLKKIKESFGSEVARIVKGATRPRSRDETPEEKKKNKLKKIEEIKVKDKKIRLVVLSDKLDNARSHPYLPKDSETAKKIPRWTREFKLLIPIAEKTNPKLRELFKSRAEKNESLL